jgi:hypothetical protein
VVDMLVGWCSWTSRMTPKVECSKPSVMVERVSVDGWMVLGGGMGYAFVWMETLADSSWWHYQGHL